MNSLVFPRCLTRAFSGLTPLSFNPYRPEQSEK